MFEIQISLKEGPEVDGQLRQVARDTLSKFSQVDEKARDEVALALKQEVDRLLGKKTLKNRQRHGLMVVIVNKVLRIAIGSDAVDDLCAALNAGV